MTFDDPWASNGKKLEESSAIIQFGNGREKDESNDAFFIFFTTGLDDTQQALIQAFVEDNAADWWHQNPEVWIVQGHTHLFWQRGLVPFFRVGHATLLLFLLPPIGRRAWGGYAPKSQYTWLVEKYAKPNGKPPGDVPEGKGGFAGGTNRGGLDGPSKAGFGSSEGGPFGGTSEAGFGGAKPQETGRRDDEDVPF